MLLYLKNCFWFGIIEECKLMSLFVLYFSFVQSSCIPTLPVTPGLSVQLQNLQVCDQYFASVLDCNTFFLLQNFFPSGGGRSCSCYHLESYFFGCGFFVWFFFLYNQIDLCGGASLPPPPPSSGIPVKCKELAVPGTMFAWQRTGSGTQRSGWGWVLPDCTRRSFGIISHSLTTWNILLGLCNWWN